MSWQSEYDAQGPYDPPFYHPPKKVFDEDGELTFFDEKDDTETEDEDFESLEK